MSLLRALRAYVGLGPDEDYDDHDLGPSSGPTALETGDEDSWPGRRSGYLDDLEPARSRRQSNAVVDLTTAKIASTRADGSVDNDSDDPSNRRRSRVLEGRPGRRGNSLSETDQLLQELVPETDPEVTADDNAAVQTAAATAADTEIEIDTEIDADESEGAVVRSIDSARSRPRTLIPESFADAKMVADEFKRGTPVVINLQDQDRDLARRLVDFASGICYALDGSMEKLAPQVFLLTPEGRQVSDQDRRRIEQRGYAR